MSTNESNGSNDSSSQSNKDIDERHPEMKYFLNESEADVVFVIDGHRLPAHKLILRFKSDVFGAMFSEPFAESAAKEIPIVDTSVDAFKTMLCFLYTDKLVLTDGKDLELIGDVAKCADKYRALRLLDAIGSHLSPMVTIDSVQRIAEIGFKYDINGLKDSINAFIMKKPYLLINKDMDYLKALNDMTDGKCLVAMAKSMLKTRQYFANTNLFIASPQTMRQMFSREPQSYQRFNNFDFDNMSSPIDPKN